MRTLARHGTMCAALILLGLASGCTQSEDPGTHLLAGPSDVYYTQGVTAAQADRAVAILTRELRINVNPCFAQQRYRDRRYEARFTMRPGAE